MSLDPSLSPFIDLLAEALVRELRKKNAAAPDKGDDGVKVHSDAHSTHNKAAAVAAG